MEPKKNNSIIIGGAVALVVAVVLYVLFRYVNSAPTIVENPTQTTQVPSMPPPNMMPKGGMMSSTYKDGTYSVTGSYYSPGGSEEIAVQLTLKNDVIVSADVQANNPSGGTAARYQKIFISNFKPYVIGKKINTVQLDRVSGASLTPHGWNDAVVKIEAEAKA